MDRVILALQQIISQNVQSQTTGQPLHDIKSVFYGDPKQIEDTSLPAIVIHPIDTDYNMRGSRYDEKIHIVEIRVVINRKNYYNDTGTPQDKVVAVEDMIKRIEAQPVNQSVSGLSICGIIQKNLCLPYTDGDGNISNVATLSKVSSVSYTFDNSRGFPTYEGVVRLEIHTIGQR